MGQSSEVILRPGNRTEVEHIASLQCFVQREVVRIEADSSRDVLYTLFLLGWINLSLWECEAGQKQHDGFEKTLQYQRKC